jgi:hypothetical protein
MIVRIRVRTEARSEVVQLMKLNQKCSADEIRICVMSESGLLISIRSSWSESGLHQSQSQNYQKRQADQNCGKITVSRKDIF